MHAKPSFAHRLQTAKIANSRTSTQNNSRRAQNFLTRQQSFLLHLKMLKRWFKAPPSDANANYVNVLNEVEWQRIFDICKRWANSGFAFTYKIKYDSIHEATRAIHSSARVKMQYTIWTFY